MRLASATLSVSLIPKPLVYRSCSHNRFPPGTSAMWMHSIVRREKVGTTTWHQLDRHPVTVPNSLIWNESLPIPLPPTHDDESTTIRLRCARRDSWLTPSPAAA